MHRCADIPHGNEYAGNPGLADVQRAASQRPALFSAQQRHLELRVDLISLISPPVYRRLVFGAGHRDWEYFVLPGRSMRELLLNCSENRTSSEEELHGPRGGVRRPKQTSWGNQPSPLRLAFEQSQAPCGSHIHCETLQCKCQESKIARYHWTVPDSAD